MVLRKNISLNILLSAETGSFNRTKTYQPNLISLQNSFSLNDQAGWEVNTIII